LNLSRFSDLDCSIEKKPKARIKRKIVQDSSLTDERTSIHVHISNNLLHRGSEEVDTSSALSKSDDHVLRNSDGSDSSFSPPMEQLGLLSNQLQSSGSEVPNPSSDSNVPNPSSDSNLPNPSSDTDLPNPSSDSNVPNPSEPLQDNPLCVSENSKEVDLSSSQDNIPKSQSKEDLEGQYKDMLGILISKVAGFRIEDGCLNTPIVLPSTSPANQNALLGTENDIPFYSQYFYGKPHTNYILEDVAKGLVIVSLPGGENEQQKRCGAIVRSDLGNQQIRLKSRNRRKTIGQMLQLSPNTVWREIRDPTFQDALVTFELNELQNRTRCKIAVLYAKEGQSENEMFSNVKGSEDFEEFIQWLGTSVLLQGWTSYSGGLDTKTCTTGERSIYTIFKGVEIMFHVSTMIPFNENDEQQVERKRHLGNDVVVIIFKEGSLPFDPKVIRSHFNSIFVVVSKLPSANSQTYYEVNICYRDSISPFAPQMPRKPVFKKDDAFRQFLFAKIINGEREAKNAPEFRQRLRFARAGALSLLTKNRV